MLAAPVTPPPLPPPDPGWPALSKGNKGDQVVWLQQHLASADPTVTVTSTFDAATDVGLRNFQASRGLPVTGTTDALTWQAVLGFRFSRSTGRESLTAPWTSRIILGA